MAQGAYGGGVRREDEAVAPAADPGFSGGAGEGDVCEAGGEEDVSGWEVSGAEFRGVGNGAVGRDLMDRQWYSVGVLRAKNSRYNHINANEIMRGKDFETHCTAGARCKPPSNRGGSTV